MTAGSVETFVTSCTTPSSTIPAAEGIGSSLLFEANRYKAAMMIIRITTNVAMIGPNFFSPGVPAEYVGTWFSESILLLLINNYIVVVTEEVAVVVPEPVPAVVVAVVVPLVFVVVVAVVVPVLVPAVVVAVVVPVLLLFVVVAVVVAVVVPVPLLGVVVGVLVLIVPSCPTLRPIECAIAITTSTKAFFAALIASIAVAPAWRGLAKSTMTVEVLVVEVFVELAIVVVAVVVDVTTEVVTDTPANALIAFLAATIFASAITKALFALVIFLPEASAACILATIRFRICSRFLIALLS